MKDQLKTKKRTKLITKRTKGFLDICTLSHCHGNTMEAFDADTPC